MALTVAAPLRHVNGQVIDARPGDLQPTSSGTNGRSGSSSEMTCLPRREDP